MAKQITVSTQRGKAAETPTGQRSEFSLQKLLGLEGGNGAAARDAVLAGRYSEKTMELIRNGRKQIEKKERAKERRRASSVEDLPPELLARYSERILKFMEENGRIPMAKEMSSMAAALSNSGSGVTFTDIIRQVEPVKAQIEIAKGIIRTSTALDAYEMKILLRKSDGATNRVMAKEFETSTVTLGKKIHGALGKIVGELEAAGVKDWAWLFSVEKPEKVRALAD